MSELKVNKISPQSGTAFTLGDSGDTFTVPSGATLTVSGTLTQTGAQTFDGGVEIDNFTINGSEIDLSSGDMTLDVAGDIILDADGGEVLFHDATTAMGHISMDSSNITLKSLVSDKDIIFQGNDGGAGITALTLDMSAAGKATFNDGVVATTVVGSGAAQFATAGIGAAKDLGAGLHIRTADSGASVNANADELVIEGSANSGISILSGNSSNGRIMFGDDGDNDIGYIEYDHGANSLNLGANAASHIKISGTDVVVNEGGNNIDFRVESDTQTHQFFIDAALNSDGGAAFNDSAPESAPGGITLNQTSYDTSILSMKSNDVAHGITSQAETDTYGLFKKNSDGNGGFKIISLSEGDNSFQVQGFVTSDNTTQNASAGAPIKLDARKKSGTSVGSMGANANLLVVQNDGTGRFIVDEDGDILYDGSASGYDSYDDAQLVRAVSNYKNPDAVIQDKFDKFVKYNYKDLQEAKILGTNSPEDNAKGLKPFIKIGALQRLHNGAIWQQYTKHQQLLEAVYELAEKTIGKNEAKAILEKHEVKRLN